MHAVYSTQLEAAKLALPASRSSNSSQVVPHRIRCIFSQVQAVSNACYASFSVSVVMHARPST